MRILAIETTGRTASVAMLEGSDTGAASLADARLDGGRTAQTLAPAIQTLLAQVGWPPSSVELVAVAVGPGSFTGLRIGVTTAKTLAYAIGAQVLGVDTMDVLAAQAPPATSSLWTIMDAQRQELFVAKFSTVRGQPERCDATRIVPLADWLKGLQPGDRVIGPPLVRLKQQLPNGVISVPDDLWQPSASSVGQVAWRLVQQGARDDVWKLAPKYLRLSAAEEKLKARIPNFE
jgi:tRNA threonylcarbamoyladenosine biosynthesis protein TsaB